MQFVGEVLAASTGTHVVVLDPATGRELDRGDVEWMFTSAVVWKGDLMVADAYHNVTTVSPVPTVTP